MKRATRKVQFFSGGEGFTRMRAEAWIIGLLGNPRSLTQGDTTFEIRQQRIREWLIRHKLLSTPATSQTNRTWAQVYERMYGEPLQATPRETTS